MPEAGLADRSGKSGRGKQGGGVDDPRRGGAGGIDDGVMVRCSGDKDWAIADGTVSFLAGRQHGDTETTPAAVNFGLGFLAAVV